MHYLLSIFLVNCWDLPHFGGLFVGCGVQSLMFDQKGEIRVIDSPEKKKTG